MLLPLLALGALLPLSGCAGGAVTTNHLPPGAQTVTITANAAGVSVSTNLTVTVIE